MSDREKVISAIEKAKKQSEEYAQNEIIVPFKEADMIIALLKKQEAKQYNSHEVACIISDLFGDPCACNFNDIDTWLPYKCDFRETCCPNPVGVACWEQYLKHKESR